MRYTFIIITLILSLLTSCVYVKMYPPEIKVGDAIGPFELITADGETISNASIKGHNAVIVFFNTWCPDCHEVLPVIQEWKDHDPESPTTYLCIARGQENNEIIPYWKENGFTMKVAADPDKEIYNLFTGGNPYGVPVIYLVDKNGILYKRILQNEELSKN